MRIAVIGTGYVGLVTGTCLAETGNYVTCIDIDAAKIKSLQKAKSPIFEPQLDELLAHNIDEGRLTFKVSLADGIKDAEVIYLALPTPSAKDGSADLSFILGVAKKLGPLLANYTVIINKSTVPVGTAETVRQAVSKGAKVEFDVISNPEFQREGFAVEDFMNPDRIVVGTGSEKARAVIKKLYSPFTQRGSPIYFMDERSAEVTKYAANSFLATKISFMNEVANLSEKVGADVDSVRLGIGADERIGKRFLFPGIGYGGSCFPKDVLAFYTSAKTNKYDFKILKAVKDVNDSQKYLIVEKIKKYFKGDIRDKCFALWGLAFKPDTDDIREAPALEIINKLTSAGAKVVAYDPKAINNVKKIYGNNTGLSFVEHEYHGLKNADALIIATEWPEFRNPDFKKIKSLLRSPVIFDGRNLYDLQTVQDAGFYYSSVGRPLVDAR